MKIFNLISLFFISCFLVMTTSCDNALETLPKDEISSQQYWNSTNDLKLYVNGLYPEAFQKGGAVRLNQDFPGELQSDNMAYTELNKRLEGSRIIPKSGGLEQYSSIREVNYFMEHYRNVKDDFEDYKQYVGEAYFFRAWFYYDLLQEYGAVPYISKTLPPDKKQLEKPRLPRNQLVDSIAHDLDQAIQYLPSDKQEEGTRLNKGVAQLLKSRVCLYEGTWEKYHSDDVFAVANPDPEKYLNCAVDAANSLMQSELYSIYAPNDPSNVEKENGNYWNLFGNVDYSSNPEVLFWKKYSVELDITHSRQYSYGASGGSAGGVGLTKSLAESYLVKDGRPIYLSDGSPNPLYQGDDSLEAVAANRDPRFTQSIFTRGFPLVVEGGDTTRFKRAAIDKSSTDVCPTGYQMNKFLSLDPGQRPGTATGGSTTGWIFFRYAEALLNYAEGKAELGTLTQEDIDKTVNRLRDRVGMPHLNISNIVTDPNWSYPNLSPAINEIRRERRVELAAEGFRWNDIARWAAADELIVGQRKMGAKFNNSDYPDLDPNNYKLTNGYLDPHKVQAPNGYQFDVSRDYLSPFSTEELTLNPKLEQNPGW